MPEETIVVPKGIYVHTKTGNLYFVDEDVDCMGKGTGDVPGVSYYRLYKPGKRCIRPAREFFQKVNLGDKTIGMFIIDDIKKRFVLLKEIPVCYLKVLLPGSVVYIPEKHIVRNMFLKDGVIFVNLIDHTGKNIVDYHLELFLRHWI